MRSRDERRDERRDEQQRYNGDVWYEVWRGGGNPDSVSYDRLHDYRSDGLSPDDAATRELRRQQPSPVEPEQEFPEEQEGPK